MPWAPWCEGVAADPDFPDEAMSCPVEEAARRLLGGCLVSTVGGGRTVAVIVETEAYGGPEDPASHAATVRGPTRRNRVMFGPPGRAYVYRSYGVHWCMNVVTGVQGQAQAVLLRGVEPVAGEALMAERRRGFTPIGAGPGRLAEALGITDALYDHDLREPPLRLQRGWAVPDEKVGVSPRVGVSAAADWPRRFFVRGSAGVSRSQSWGGRRGSPARPRG